MARVRITNVVVLNNPCKFFDPFQFQITFECLEISDGKQVFIRFIYTLYLLILAILVPRQLWADNL